MSVAWREDARMTMNRSKESGCESKKKSVNEE